MDNGRRFRSVFGGWRTNPDTGKRQKQFKWQEFAGLDADGEEVWNPVKCWSHIVFAEVADELGYEVRKDKQGRYRKTTAYEGDRAIGNEHSLDPEGENAMEVLARAACSDEELGLVPPRAEETDADAEDRADAEALGLSLENYRRLVAERG